jgi:hypothetical protein
MRPFVANSQLATRLLIASSLASACGGLTGNDNVAQGGHAGGGQVGDAGDAGSPYDAGDGGTTDCPRLHCVYYFKYVLSSAQLENCSFQLNGSPSDPSNVVVFANCTRIPYVVDASAFWRIDYTRSPADFVFVGSACDQVKASQNVVVDFYEGPCSSI